MYVRIQCKYDNVIWVLIQQKYNEHPLYKSLDYGPKGE